MKKLVLALTGAVCLLTLPAMANDDGLYDPAPPAGSAFVRVINASAGNVTPDIRGKAYHEIAAGQVGAYVPVKKGDAEVKLDKATDSVDLDEGAFYTVLYTGDTADVLKDDAIKNDTKALIAFYNVTGKETLSLKTADGKVEVIPAIATGKSAYREINAVKVKLAVYEGDKNVLALEPLALRRREPTAIVVMEKDGKPVAQALQAKTDSTQ